MPLASPVARVSGVMRSVIALVVCVSAVAACGGDESQSPSLSSVIIPATPASPVGFDRKVAVATGAEGTVTMCLWVADTAERRSVGMMGSDSFGDADAMVFVADAPTSGRFWMWNTRIDLSIAFFDGDGLFLDAFDMTVCQADNSDECARYDTPSGYLMAIESAVGDLDRLGLTSGSSVVLTDETCSAAMVP